MQKLRLQEIKIRTQSLAPKPRVLTTLLTRKNKIKLHTAVNVTEARYGEGEGLGQIWSSVGGQGRFLS